MLHNRTHEHQVSMLQRLESTSEHIILQSQIQTSYWSNALQHPAMSCQVSAVWHFLYINPIMLMLL